ncbi:MAG: hypothetical protein JSV09_07365 [Thermoplasmata archaeon]|nr:MAG: hypothetical protein JSV09_07365 [Thermoplasmata archaeon]
MKFMRKALILILIIFFVFLLPVVSASDDSIKVLLLVGNPGDEGIYDVGESIPIEVRVFDSGQPIDADSPPTVTLNPNEPYKREISVLKTSSGIYSGSFTIREDDADEYLSIRAQATLGKENEEDTSYDDDTDSNSITISGEWGLDLDFKFDKTGTSHMVASPGDTIDMTITVRYDGLKVNPDYFDLTAGEKSISYTNPNIGVIKASYKIESTITESKSIYINADCDHNGESYRTGGDIQVDLCHVWYHKVSITDSIVQFELALSDMEGKAISDARIDFNYEIDNTDIQEDSPFKSGITDSQGKAEFTISHDSAYFIWIEGSAEFLGKIQNFEWFIEISQEVPSSDNMEPSPSYDFQVIYQENSGVIENSEEVTLEYIAYSKGNPLPNQQIYYYIYTESEFIKSGFTTTDSQGKFTVIFRTPDVSKVIDLMFESAFEKEYYWEHVDCDDGLVYRDYHGYIWISDGGSMEINWGDPDTSISIETSSLTIGGETTITAKIQDSDDCIPWAFIVPGVYSSENILDSSADEPEWTSCMSSTYNLLIPKNGKFSLDIILPDFLPKDETYTVLVIYIDYDDTDSPYHWNYIHLNPGESTGSKEEEQNILLKSPLNIGGIGISWLAIIVIIALILVVVVVGARRKRTGRTEPFYQYQAVFEDMTPIQPKQGPFTPKYPQQPVIFREDYPDYEVYPSPHTQPPVPGSAYPEEDNTIGVTCSGCQKRFYVQGQDPPFKTICPFCSWDNMVF